MASGVRDLTESAGPFKVVLEHISMGGHVSWTIKVMLNDDFKLYEEQAASVDVSHTAGDLVAAIHSAEEQATRRFRAAVDNLRSSLGRLISLNVDTLALQPMYDIKEKKVVFGLVVKCNNYLVPLKAYEPGYVLPKIMQSPDTLYGELADYISKVEANTHLACLKEALSRSQSAEVDVSAAAPSVIRAAGRPLTPAEVYDALRKQGYSGSYKTVYTTLRVLERKGVLIKMPGHFYATPDMKAEPPLRPLQREVLEVVRKYGPITVRDIWRRLSKEYGENVSYFTMYSTLEQLVRWGFIAKSGRGIYVAADRAGSEAK